MFCALLCWRRAQLEKKTRSRRRICYWHNNPALLLAALMPMMMALLLDSSSCWGAPMERRTKREEAEELRRYQAMKYLHEFGHLSSPIPTPSELKNGLETFQDMAGLEQNGQLDADTLEQMSQPRCGNSDVSRAAQRRRRFVYISRWEGKMNEGQLKLKWFLQNYTPDIPREEIRRTVQQAFHLWSSQVNIPSAESISLLFEEAQREADADITILWAEGDHGDAHMFDGPGEEGSNILAHTFYPNFQFKGTLNGDIHLDDYEQWNVNNSRQGASFPHVLVHEIGHTLGLGHSKKQQAIMFPIYRKEQLDQMQLDMDDKCAINWSYVGATDLCLYIWLLSEVLPKKVAIEEAAAVNVAAAVNSPNKQLSQNMLEQQQQQNEEKEGGGLTTHEDGPSIAGEGVGTVMEMVRTRLAGKPMPDCGPGPGGRMRHQLADLLRRRLSFPKDMALPYANIVCRFFDAFRQEYGLPSTRHLHQVIRPWGAHSYLQPNDNFLQMERALNREDRTEFNADFFAELMATFMGSEKMEEKTEAGKEETGEEEHIEGKGRMERRRRRRSEASSQKRHGTRR